MVLFGSRSGSGLTSQRLRARGVRRRPVVEPLEERSLLSVMALKPHGHVAPAAARPAVSAASSDLPSVSLFVSTRGPYHAGQSVTLFAAVAPGTDSATPLTYQFEIGPGPNGPWTPLNAPSASSSLTVTMSQSGRASFLVIARILVDTDHVSDGDEAPEGFQDAVDLSGSSQSPRTLASSSVALQSDVILAFAALAAGGADAKHKDGEISDTLKVVNKVVIFTTNKQNLFVPVYENANSVHFFFGPVYPAKSLKGDQPEGNDDPLATDTITIKIPDINVMNGKGKIEKTQLGDVSQAIIVKDADGKTSDVILKEVTGRGINVVFYKISLISNPSDGSDLEFDNKLNINTTNVDEKTLIPKKAKTFVDVAPMLFPEYVAAQKLNPGLKIPFAVDVILDND